jgi:hypothetical protein
MLYTLNHILQKHKSVQLSLFSWSFFCIENLVKSILPHLTPMIVFVSLLSAVCETGRRRRVECGNPSEHEPSVVICRLLRKSQGKFSQPHKGNGRHSEKVKTLLYSLLINVIAINGCVPLYINKYAAAFTISFY